MDIRPLMTNVFASAAAAEMGLIFVSCRIRQHATKDLHFDAGMAATALFAATLLMTVAEVTEMDPADILAEAIKIEKEDAAILGSQA